MSELDPALERLHLCGFEDAEGFPNYGPMAVSALEQLGHAALITGLVDVYVPRLPDWPEAKPAVTAAQTQRQGDSARAADRVEAYVSRLALAPWAGVLDEVVAQRCVGDAASPVCPHAWVRLGYAVRNLERLETSVRLRELAFSLVGLLRPTASQAGGVAAQEEAWLPGIDDAAAEDLAAQLGALSIEGAARYLAHPDQRVQLALGITGPAAIRALLPFLSAACAARAVASLSMGLAAKLPSDHALGRSAAHEDLEVLRCAEDPSEVRYRAACSVHEQAIVTAESALREEDFTGSPVLRRAAADAALRSSPPGYREWR